MSKTSSCCHSHHKAQPKIHSKFFTCPMCPSVKETKMGICPLCGMALEPPLFVKDNSELKDMKRRFFLALAFTLPLVVIAMGDFFESIKLKIILEMLLSTVVVFWLAWPFHRRAYDSLKSKLNMFSLVSLGVLSSYFYSVMAVFFPFLFPQESLIEGFPPVYFESASMIVTFIFLGQVLELKGREKTQNSIEKLFDLTPKKALKKEKDGAQVEVPVEEIQIGDLLVVQPGTKIPTDGRIIEGEGFFNESMLTGESEKIFKSKGDSVLGGTLSEAGFLMEVTKTVENNMVSQMIAMVREAQRSPAPVQKFVDQVSAVFVPVVMGIAVLTLLIWFFKGESSYAFLNMVAVLMISCPCALGLATPMSLMVGLGKAAEKGVLFKNTKSLELLNKVDTLLLDKTGTLTEGKTLSEVTALSPWSQKEILYFIGSLEQRSEHVLGKSLLKECKKENISLSEPTKFESFSGQGISGTVDGREVFVGHQKWIESLGFSVGELFKGEKKSVIFLVIDKTVAGGVSFSDPIKTSAKSVLSVIHKKCELFLLTGDKHSVAKEVASHLGLENVKAECLPQEKWDFVKQLQEQGKRVAMAGDGINDAPALTQAHVGIAMGNGTDIAMESADVVLVKGDLTGILRAFCWSELTLKNIKENLFFAFVYNVVGIPIAAGILGPFGVFLNPSFAALAMSLSSVSVVFNSLRLKYQMEKSEL